MLKKVCLLSLSREAEKAERQHKSGYVKGKKKYQEEKFFSFLTPQRSSFFSFFKIWIFKRSSNSTLSLARKRAHCARWVHENRAFSRFRLQAKKKNEQDATTTTTEKTGQHQHELFIIVVPSRLAPRAPSPSDTLSCGRKRKKSRINETYFFHFFF